MNVSNGMIEKVHPVGQAITLISNKYDLPYEIEKIIQDKQAIYDLTVDKTTNKIGNGDKLEKFELEKLPIHIQLNKDNYKEWID